MLTGKRVLVIDDAEAERMLISTYLQTQGCRLYHAQNGEDGIQKARLLGPDLILMDAEMPRCDGFAACRVLSEDPATAHVPIIFLSAYAEPEQRVRGLLAGAVDYIGKPFDFDEVRLRLSVHLRQRPEPTAPPPVHGDPGAGESHDANLHGLLFQGARVHLLKSLREPPGVHELAELIGTNAKRLNEAFRHCAGVTISEYLREERMKEASRLLRHTDASITEIAESIGFGSGANFSTAFKTRFGLTPKHYRHQRTDLDGD